MGGLLGTSADWYWYNGTCGGSSIGNGTSVTVSPAITTAYYVRGEGVCNTTLCMNVTVTVQDSSIAADSVTATLSAICESQSTMLGVSGGMLGTLSDWYWYEGSCGGSSTGNGTSILVSPTITTDYFVRGEGVCNTTPCVDVMVTVNDSSIAANNAITTTGYDMRKSVNNNRS